MAWLLEATPSQVSLCADRLSQGHVVALPTETVYGLAALASHEEAVRHIFHLKNRPALNPLIVHVNCVERVKHQVMLSPLAQRCADLFWPGPLTLVCPLRPGHGLAPSVTAGLNTVALRVPAHPLMQEILSALGQPLAAPSANLSGCLSLTHASLVAQAFAHEEDLWVLDGGPCAIGVESTIVDTTCHPWRVLRSGGITFEALQDVLGRNRVALGLSLDREPSEVRSPGQLLRHYAPRLPLRKDILHPNPQEAFVGFGEAVAQFCHINLSPSGSLEEAASRLFSALHTVDQPDVYQGIAVAPIPNFGLGRALNERLAKAAEASSQGFVKESSRREMVAKPGEVELHLT